MDDARIKVTQFRIASKQVVPYLGQTIYGMPAHPAPCGTMAVDKYGRLYYDPRFVGSISEATGRFAILHETMHIALRHCDMAEKFLGKHATPAQLRRWNVAVDIVVNGLLAHWLSDAPEGICTADGYGFPPKLTPIQYYHLLEQQEEEQRQQQQQREQQAKPPQFEDDDDQSQRGDGVEDDDSEDEETDDEDGSDAVGDSAEDASGERDRGAGSPEDEEADAGRTGGGGEEDHSDEDGDGDSEDDSEWDADEGTDPRVPNADGEETSPDGDESTGVGSGGVDSGSGGSGADGVPRSWELPPDPGSEDREYAMFADLEEAIIAAEAANPGSVPGELKDAVDLRMRPQPDPWNSLRGAVARAASTTQGAPVYTYRRFSRRQQPDLPRLTGIIRQTPAVVVILDTSGSMGGPKSERFVKALDVIAKGVARLRSVKVVCADTHPHRSKIVQSMQQFQIVGGGGTDMAGAIEAIDRDEKPDSILLISDCECYWNERKPRAKVVIADVGGLWHDRIPQHFAKIDLTKGGE